MSEKAEEARRADESSEEAGAATEEEAAEEGDEELARMRRELAEGDSAELVVARYSNCSARPACSLHRPATTRLLLPPPRQHTASHRRRALPHSARQRRLSARGRSTDAFACAVLSVGCNARTRGARRRRGGGGRRWRRTGACPRRSAPPSDGVAATPPRLTFCGARYRREAVERQPRDSRETAERQPREPGCSAHGPDQARCRRAGAVGTEVTRDCARLPEIALE